MRSLFVKFFVMTSILFTLPAHADEFEYLEKVTLLVGDSVILKGVRHKSCGDYGPRWESISGKLPKSKLGQFSDGGHGKVNSNRCGGIVGARGVKFTAKKTGNERLKIFGDYVRITVE